MANREPTDEISLGMDFTTPYEPPVGFQVEHTFPPNTQSLAPLLGAGEGMTVSLLAYQVGNDFGVDFHSGESLDGFLSIPSAELSVELGVGETQGHLQYSKKDTRLHDAGQVFPWSMGEAFLASSLTNWPSGYSLAAPYQHFYEHGFGVDLHTTTWFPLVSSTPSDVLVFGSGYQAIPVWSGSVQFFALSLGESFTSTVSTEYILPIRAWVGESLNASVLNDRRLSLSLSTGEALSVDVDVENIATNLGVGESIDVALQAGHIFAHQSRTGESLTVSLAGTASLAPNFSTGEAFVGDLGARPAIEFSPRFYDGQAQTAPLWTRMSFDVSLGEGASASNALFLPYRADFSVNVFDGSWIGVTTIQTAISLGGIGFVEGVSFRLDGQMGEQSNYRAATGESVRFELHVEPGFVITCYDGASADAIVSTRPAQSMDVRFWTGEIFYSPVLDVLVAVHLQAYFYDGVFVTPTEETSTVVFDLADPVPYVDTLDWWLDLNLFEIEQPLASRGWGAGTDVLVTVSLETRPRFSISFADGQSWALEGNSLFFELPLSSGFMPAWGRSESFYVEPLINLCYPNVFPNADDMEVELDFTEESCYADFVFVGESVAMDLGCVYNVAPQPLPTGEHLDCNLTVYDIWRMHFWTGEHLDCYLATDMNLTVRATTGESLRITFEEPSVLVGEGSTLTATLTNTFDVEFLERGCLDNEYKYINENGDEDASKFNPVAVELEPFQHEIKARCL